MDSKHGVFLALLDLSAAFDTIDHNILISRLKSENGVEGVALKWFESYLRNRTQVVKIDDSCSDGTDISFGVPQGSVLGPQLFTVYTRHVATIAREHGLNVHLYADDTQLYLSFDLKSQSDEEQVRLRGRT